MPKIINGNASQVVTQYDLRNNLEELAVELARKAHMNVEEEIPPSVSDNDSQFDKAIRQAEEILRVARTEADLIKEEARQAGYNAGFLEGQQEGSWQARQEHGKKLEMDRTEAINEMERCIADLEVQKQRILEEHLDDLKNLSIAISEKVMRVGMQSSGDIIKRMIVAATEKISRVQWVKIYISRYDAELMESGDVRLLESLSHLSENIKVIKMDREEQGTCIIELPKEIIDASVSTQMENIRSILHNIQL